jgi:prepilin-type N-terminal cleavage/methylation domain-containing protein
MPRGHFESNAEGGFTLLEVVVAVSILSIALMGIMALYVHTIALSEVNRETQIATFAAQSKLDEIRAMNFNNILTTYPPGASTYFAVSGLRAFAPDPQPGSVTTDNTNANLINVQVRVRWQGVRGEGTVTFTTMVSP